MNAIIIEDETVAARNLKTILNHVAPDVNIIAVLDSVQASTNWLKNHLHPDVIFMDIHLSDGESFLIFEQVEINVPVVFTTAYDAYALQAFKANGIDYLLKPINPEEVTRALMKLKHFSGLERRMYASRVSEMSQKRSYLKTLLISYKDKIIPVDTQDIMCFYSRNEKVQVFTTSGAVFQTEKKLNTLAELLDPSLFFRANRQFIVSKKAIKEMDVWFGNRLCIELALPMPEKIVVSKERTSDLKLWLTMDH